MTALFQRLKTAVELTVHDILKEVGAETGTTFTAETSANLSELAVEKVVRSAGDLQAFAGHARRQAVGGEDVRLLTRRNPELVSGEGGGSCLFTIEKLSLFCFFARKLIYS